MSSEQGINKNTISNIVSAAAFIIIGVAVVILLSLLFGRKDGLQVYDSLSVNVKANDIKSEPDNSIQVLFYGDSEGYAAFYPKLLESEYNINSFVCATAAQHLCDSYAIMNENVKTQSPKVIVLETNCLYRNLDDDEFGKDIVMRYLYDKSDLFAYHSDWKIVARKALPKKREVNRRKNRGFVVRKGVIPYKGGKYMKKTDSVEKIPETNIKYLEQINSFCKEHNIAFVLVSVPSPTNWSYKRHNGVAEWALSNSVTYIDLNLEKSLKINWKKDSKDGGDHMNLAGAKKVTRFLGRYLADNYNLK